MNHIVRCELDSNARCVYEEDLLGISFTHQVDVTWFDSFLA